MKWGWGGSLFNWYSDPKKHSPTLHPRFPWYEKRTKEKRFYKEASKLQLFNHQEIVCAKAIHYCRKMTISTVT